MRSYFPKLAALVSCVFLALLAFPSASFSISAHELSHELVPAPIAPTDLHARVIEVLLRMEARRKARTADADRMGVILPSQRKKLPPAKPAANEPVMFKEYDLSGRNIPQPSQMRTPVSRPSQTLQLSFANKVVPPAVAPAPIEPAPNLKLSSETPFENALRKASRGKDRREADAKRLNVTLPSHGGPVSGFSKALPMLSAALEELINRIPEELPANYGFFPG